MTGTTATAGFFALGERAPDRTALVAPEGARHTFGELRAAAGRLARGLRRLGLAPGDVVALAAPNGVAFVEVFAATMEAGLWLVPLNWHLTADELRYILANSGAKVVVGHERFAADVGPAGDVVEPSRRFSVGTVAGFRPLAELSDLGELAGGHADVGFGGSTPGRGHGRDGGAGAAAEAARPLVLFYTSGTTGQPKGVRKRLPPATNDTIGLASGIGLPVPDLDQALASEEVCLVGGPLYHAAPLAALARALDEGAQVVLMDRWTPEGFLDLVARHRVTQASMVPTMFHRLLALPGELRRGTDLSSLRSVSHAGAPCPPDVKRRIIDWFGPIVTESYSSTEGAGTTVTAAEWLARPGTVGRPVPGVTLRILDDEGRSCPPGVPGRVFLSQALWQFEYHGDPDKTAAARTGELFTVGDIGYLDDEGYLFLCDRVADVIVSGGVNIYPAEVEAVLLEHPAVADVAVVGAPNDEWGEEVRAVAEVRPGREPSSELSGELIDFCRARLAHFKCPVEVEFVESLGRDPNGKVRKRQIRDRYWEGRTRKI